jgi:hypothetical protein
VPANPSMSSALGLLGRALTPVAPCRSLSNRQLAVASAFTMGARITVTGVIGYVLAGIARINPNGIVALGTTLLPHTFYIAVSLAPTLREPAVVTASMVISVLVQIMKNSSLGFTYITIFRRQHMIASMIIRAACWLVRRTPYTPEKGRTHGLSTQPP